jgi:exosome complex component RRP4
MKIVLPGDKISDGPVRMENTIVENGKTYATVIGMLDESKGAFVPLESVWYPRQGDFVIGIVENSKNNVQTVQFDSPFRGLILPPPRPRFGGRGRDDRFGGGPREERQEVLHIGDVVSAFVKDVKRESDQIILILERPKRLFGGKLVEVRPSKVPRIIGKASTMLKQLEDGTKCTILVGLNGIIWVNGGNVALAQKAITKIQEEAHIGGLTERISELLTSGSINRGS